MSNTDSAPQEFDRETAADGGASGSFVEVIESREVPLGGPRAMTVRRTLPTHERSMVGAWCFADHYGPDNVADVGGMNVPPHPHTGLQTVSWLFEGEVEHTDSAGVHAYVLPGEINLMSAGFGISHSEVSTPQTQRLHGVQLWLALPDRVRNARNGFQHFVPESVDLPDVHDGGPGGTAKVFIGELASASADIATATPLLGAELIVNPGARITLAVNPDFEHGVLLDTERLLVEGIPIGRSELAYVSPGHGGIRLHNPTDSIARIILLGGPPFDENIVMWWNFVARSHEEIVEYRREWENRTDRFGSVEGWRDAQYLPAPPLPTTRLKPRKRSKQMTEQATDETKVTRNDEAGRYEIAVNGEVAGFTVFIDRGDQRIFPHTVVDDKFSGRGLSSILIREALADTRTAGKRVVPVCPLVARYVSKHEDVADLVDPVTPEILQFLSSR